MVVVAGDIAHEYGYFWLEIFFIASLGGEQKFGLKLNRTPTK